LQLLGYGHAATGRLFAVPERRIEDPDAIVHSWKVLHSHYRGLPKIKQIYFYEIVD